MSERHDGSPLALHEAEVRRPYAVKIAELEAENMELAEKPADRDEIIVALQHDVRELRHSEAQNYAKYINEKALRLVDKQHFRAAIEALTP